MLKSLVALRLIRSFSSDASKTPARTTGWGGGGLWNRISSFFIGAGLTALVTQYYIYEELREGNKLMLEKHYNLEKRLGELEKAVPK